MDGPGYLALKSHLRGLFDEDRIETLCGGALREAVGGLGLCLGRGEEVDLADFMRAKAIHTELAAYTRAAYGPT